MSTLFPELFKPVAHDQRRSMALVRVALVLLLILHPLHALLYPEDARALARLVDARGLPFGLALSWGALSLQLASAIALAVPRAAFAGALGSLAVIAGGTLLYAPRWYVVGGLAEEGAPGIEFNALLLACLSAVAWTHRPRRPGAPSSGSGAAGIEIVRVASALSLLAHGYGPFVLRDVEGMRGWGQAMSAHGWPLGLALVWSIKVGELVAALLRVSRRLVVPACFVHLSYLVPGMWISHHLRWFVVGPGEEGIEFSVLIAVCTVACIASYWPRREAQAEAMARPDARAFT